MRLEDKSLERRDIVDNEQAELLEQAQIDEYGEQRFRTRAQGGAHTPDGYGEKAHLDEAARTDLFVMMRDIFDGKEVATHRAQDPMHQKAIDMLAAAVRGHHPRDRTFVFAEDRRMMLEQSLAALQPVIAMGAVTMMDHHAEGLTDEFARLIGDVNGLRAELAKLEATQEEYEPLAIVGKGKAGDEDEDEDEDAKDDGAAEDAEGDEPLDVRDASSTVAVETAKSAGGAARRIRGAAKQPAPDLTLLASRKPADS
ncbi:MAG: hypothetical protein KBG15_13350 [Kofleriaceae bacterium]|nr:hypothetical protein [Kofleriaceae bacterium]